MNSPTARSIIDEGLAEGDIWIFKSPSATSGGIPFSKVIRISLIQFSGPDPLQYMGSDGRLHAETAEDAIIHELIHAVYGWDDLIDPTTLVSYDDPNAPPRDYNNPNFDHVGATQRLANQVLLELGLPTGMQQVGYDAINRGSRTSYLRTDISYSEDNAVDIAYFDSPNSATPNLLDLSRRTDGSRDLIIGFEGADVINGGAGNDYLYGGVGDDVISGGSGDDVIHGGDRKTSIADDGTDTADYSKGDMQAGPLHGVTVDIDPGLATTADKMDGLTPIIVSDDGYGGRDRLFSIEKIKLSDHADTVHIGKDSQDLLASLQEIDAGGNPDDEPDVLDFSKFGSGVTLKDLKIDGVDATFKNFEKIVLSDKADTFRVISLGNLNGLQEVDAGDNPSSDPDIADFSQTTQSLQFANGSVTDGQSSLKLTNFENLIGSASDDTIDLTNSTIKFVNGGAGNDTLTANGTGATLDGSIGNNVYVGGAGADKFVIGNGEFAQQGTNATFEIKNAGADDRLVLRLDDTLGFGDAANWTKGVVLNGGIYWPDDPDWISAISDSVVYNPTGFNYGGRGSDFVRISQLSRETVRPELGDYSVVYEWDKAGSVLNIQIETSYGNFWVKVDDFQEGDLGLNFTAIDNVPEFEDIPTIDGENKIKASWATYDDAMKQFIQGAQIVDLESPGSPVAGNATRNNFFPETVGFPNSGNVGPGAAYWLDPWPGPGASMASLSASSSVSATTPQATGPGADEVNGQVLQLVQALATYPGDNAGSDPAGSSPLALPNDSGLQTAMAAAWHAAA